MRTLFTSFSGLDHNQDRAGNFDVISTDTGHPDSRPFHREFASLGDLED